MSRTTGRGNGSQVAIGIVSESDDATIAQGLLRDAPSGIVSVTLCATERIGEGREEARAVVTKVIRACFRARAESRNGQASACVVSVVSSVETTELRLRG